MAFGQTGIVAHQIAEVLQNIQRIGGGITMAKWVRPSNLLVIIGIAGLVELVYGLWLQSSVCLGGGAVAVCASALSMRRSFRSDFNYEPISPRQAKSRKGANTPETTQHLLATEPTDTETLVEEMLTTGRFPLLLRKQILGNLDADQLERSQDALSETMCLVPSGPVLLLPNGGGSVNGSPNGPAFQLNPSYDGSLVDVEALFLDRHTVTNAQYQQFVDDGGYEQLTIWDEQALPALIDSVDATGLPGPRFWLDGMYPEGEANLPVVGISWFEANAFARWCGKRLPTDAEWVRAGAWPMESSPGNLTQRRYPWGDSFQPNSANIWGAGPEQTVAVDEFSIGVSVGGAVQLVGNVWEWTASHFGSPQDQTLRLPTPMRSLRGGAYDTYFENQATCHFQSGDNPLARRHNVGFRLAVAVRDLAPEATGLLPTTAMQEEDNLVLEGSA